MGCEDCQDGFILITCCTGKDCGCAGQPIAMQYCRKCNPSNLPPEKTAGSELLFYYERLEKL